MATEDDKAHHIDRWAKLFTATRWEGAGCPGDIRLARTGKDCRLQMLADENSIIKEASETVYILSEEEKIRQQCLAREDYYRTQNDMHLYYGKKLDEKDATIAEKEATIAALQAELNALKNKDNNSNS